MTTHSRFAPPSSAFRWRKCPGSAWMLKGIEAPTSKYMEEGIKAHGIAANALLTGTAIVPASAGPLSPFGEITEDMAFHVNKYVDYCRGISAGSGVAVVERELSLKPVYGYDERGTPDFLYVDGDAGILTVVDYKNGNSPISARYNHQVMIYGLAALAVWGCVYDINTVRLVIVQPKVSDNPDVWSVPADELSAMLPALLVDVDAAKRCYDSEEVPPKEFFRPSERVCAWCEAFKQMKCPYPLNRALEVMQISDMSDADALSELLAAIPTMSNEKLDAMYPVLGLMDKAVAGIRAEIYGRAARGVSFTNCKLVDGRKGNRKWIDEKEAEKIIRGFRLAKDSIYVQHLASPTAILGLLKKLGSERRIATVENLITRSDGAPTLVSISNPAPAIAIATATDFENVSEQ